MAITETESGGKLEAQAVMRRKRGRWCEMIYICVRTYGNGRHMNKVHNLWFDWLSQADRMCTELNDIDAEIGEKWIPVPLNCYIGEVWEKGGAK